MTYFPIPHKQYTKFQKQAEMDSRCENEVDYCLSDMDMGYNKETGEYDLPAVEWDGYFGSYWEYFNTEDERQARLDKYEAECKAAEKAITAGAVVKLKALCAAYQEKRKFQESVKPTLGNLCAEAFKSLKK